MSRRPFPVLAVSIGLAVALMAVLQPVRGQPKSDATAKGEPASFPIVRIATHGGGSPLEGRLKLRALNIKTEIGTASIDFSHIKKITLYKDAEGHAHDRILLTDNSLQRGEVVDSEWVIEHDGGRTELNTENVREVTVLSEAKLALVAILLGLLTLTLMEIVLGVDNVIFIAIIAGKLPEEQRPRARRIGLLVALGTRLALLFSLSFLLGLTTPVFTLPDIGFLRDMEARDISWRDIILLAGGLFLIGKSTFEIHEKLEHAKSHGQPSTAARVASFAKVIVTIAIFDIVFSLDSVITAIGMVEELWVMVVAMVLAMLVMLYFAEPIGKFVDKHPTLKVLALAFLILIGVMLVAEGLGQHIDKGYIYAAMAFSVVVEMVNMQLRKGPKPPTTPATAEVAR